MSRCRLVALCLLVPALCSALQLPGLQSALDGARRVLEDNRRGAVLPAHQVAHRWDDKYLLAEWLTDTTMASLFQGLTRLGLTAAHTGELQEWAGANHSVYLQFEANHQTDLLEERVRVVESDTVVEQEVTSQSWLGETVAKKVKTQVRRNVPEWVWESQQAYTISAVRGNDKSEVGLRLVGRVAKEQRTTTTATPPHTPVDASLVVDISWLVKHLRATPEGLVWGFQIDREQAATPRRNAQVEAVLQGSRKLREWSATVQGQMKAAQPGARALGGGTPVFILPLLRSGESANHTCTLDPSDTNKLLQEAAGTLDGRLEQLGKPGPSGQPPYPEGHHQEPFSMVEVQALLALEYMQESAGQYGAALGFVEAMIQEQLVAAIGSHVSPADFGAYMRGHHRKLFNAGYSPAPFSLAVRQSEQHSPEGTLSIEHSGLPVQTLSTASSSPVAPMSFPLDASTQVRFGGTRHLHALLDHKFSLGAHTQLQLVARARQFSSMVVVLGRIVGKHGFEPQQAVIVQNKDELTIPLELAAIPSPKEFKEAVESLSATQRGFAKAIRSMQLESTLFGVLVIQAKPQLERVLNLPRDSLTKEIQLTQDLMSLLLEHEIPSDLLSHSQAPQEGAQGAVEAVRGHVLKMSQMIQQAKARELEEQQRLHKYNAEPRQKIHKQHHEQVRALSLQAAASSAPPEGVRMRLGASAGARDPPDGFEESGFQELSAPEVLLSVNQPPIESPTQAPSASADAKEHASTGSAQSSAGAEEQQGDGVDYSAIAAEIDGRIERMDSSGALRPTIINIGGVWHKKSRKGLLGGLQTHRLAESAQGDEKSRAFGLLDALTRGGGLQLEDAALHVVVAATHQFDKSVMQTVVQDNVNPIERVERSTLILASCVHRTPVAQMVSSLNRDRISSYPELREAAPPPATNFSAK